jgi:hypothetical protein
MNSALRMKKKIEKVYPLGLSILTAICFQFLYCDSKLMLGATGAMAENLITICSTFFGFFLTILTIIESLQTPALKVIRQAKVYPLLLSYLQKAIIVNFIAIPVIIILKVLIEDEGMKSDIFYTARYFVEIYVFLISFRFIRLFVKIIK